QARACGVPVTVVRPYSGYGEDQRADWPFGAYVARARRRADPFEIWGDGTQVRDWIHAADVVAGAPAVAEGATGAPVSRCTVGGTGDARDEKGRLPGPLDAARFPHEALDLPGMPLSQPAGTGAVVSTAVEVAGVPEEGGNVDQPAADVNDAGELAAPPSAQE